MRTSNRFFVASVFAAGCITPPDDSHPVTIEIEPRSISVVENDGASVKAIVRDAKGRILPEPVTWMSRNPAVAEVFDPGQIVNGIEAGTTTIEARAGEAIGTATVTVTPGTVTRVTVWPHPLLMVPGQRTEFTVYAQDWRALPLKHRTATFSTDDADVVQLDLPNIATGRAEGRATVTVVVEGVSTEVPARVFPPSLSLDYFRRDGAAVPGTATLTFPTADINRGKLAIDGKSLDVRPQMDLERGVLCMTIPVPILAPPDAIVHCAFDSPPLSMRLCTPRGLEYVVLPAADPGRAAASASALLAALQGNTMFKGINAFTDCASAVVIPGQPDRPRWVRNAPDTNYFLWPNTTVVYPATSLASMLANAVIYSQPGAASDFSKYVVIRVSPGVFELWH